jgi:hypothetical protein
MREFQDVFQTQSNRIFFSSIQFTFSIQLLDTLFRIFPSYIFLLIPRITLYYYSSSKD